MADGTKARCFLSLPPSSLSFSRGKGGRWYTSRGHRVRIRRWLDVPITASCDPRQLRRSFCLPRGSPAWRYIMKSRDVYRVRNDTAWIDRRLAPGPDTLTLDLPLRFPRLRFASLRSAPLYSTLLCSVALGTNPIHGASRTEWLVCVCVWCMRREKCRATPRGEIGVTRAQLRSAKGAK